MRSCHFKSHPYRAASRDFLESGLWVKNTAVLCGSHEYSWTSKPSQLLVCHDNSRRGLWLGVQRQSYVWWRASVYGCRQSCVIFFAALRSHRWICGRLQLQKWSLLHLMTSHAAALHPSGLSLGIHDIYNEQRHIRANLPHGFQTGGLKKSDWGPFVLPYFLSSFSTIAI